eukprot:7373713-Lingulodinium_polyedra.AAC.1
MATAHAHHCSDVPMPMHNCDHTQVLHPARRRLGMGRCVRAVCVPTVWCSPGRAGLREGWTDYNAPFQLWKLWRACLAIRCTACVTFV